jgi:anti-sigma factor RsiW
MLYCQDVELLLQDYLDGYLLPSQREILESHLRGCDGCRALLNGITRVDDRMEGLSTVEAPPDLGRSILAALPPRAYGPSPLRRALAFAAAPALALLLVGAGLLVKGRFQLRGMAAERSVEVVYAAPQAATVALVGDFNGWNPQRTQMVRVSREGLWRARIRLSPGVYQYSFVVDGTSWVPDPQAKSTLADGFGGNNSVIVVDG